MNTTGTTTTPTTSTVLPTVISIPAWSYSGNVNSYTVTGPGSGYIGAGGGGGGGYSYTQPATYPTHINGDLTVDGDIKIGGKSLAEILATMESRLGLLHANPELEEKWTQLKELGDKYREIEKDLQEKEAMWNLLKK